MAERRSPRRASRERASKVPEVLGITAYFLTLTFVILGKAILSPGIITGGDWSTPVTRLQIETSAISGLFLWTHVTNVFGLAQPYLSPLTSAVFWVFAQILDGPGIDRVILLFVYTFSGATVYSFARFLGLTRSAALIAGSLYVATPVFFNYTAMGWAFILFGFSLVPWVITLFARCVKEGGVIPVVEIGLLLAVGFNFASQCVAWYPIAMLVTAPFLIRSRTQLWRATRALVLCGVLLLVLNLNWVLPLLSYGSPVLSSAAADRAHLYGHNLHLLNIVRGWGSLFNYQYETAYPKALWPLSFVPAAVGYAVFLLRTADVRARLLVSLTLVPVVFFLLPAGFYRLPFTSVIEERSRFILFQALASSLLVGLAFDRIRAWRPASTGWRRHSNRGLAAGTLVVLFLGAYPVWSGELTGPSKHQADIRLRTLRLPGDYDRVEQDLARADGSAKALYFPTGGHVNVPADSRFAGPYREFADSYAAYAPRSGAILKGDRRAGADRAIAAFLGGPDFLSASSGPSETLGALGIRWIVVRPSLRGHEYLTEALSTRLDADERLLKRYDEEVVVYENLTALPVIYASTDPVLNEVDASDGIADAFADGFTARRRVAFFRDSVSNVSDQHLRKSISSVSKQPPSITFRRINPTRIDIRVDGATGPFFLVMSDSFDPRWRLSPIDAGVELPASTGGGEAQPRNDFVWSDAFSELRPLPESAHFVANGYANAWYIDPKPNETTLAFRAAFVPQSLAYIGSALSGLAFAALIGAVAVCRIRRRSTPRPAFHPFSPR